MNAALFDVSDGCHGHIAGIRSVLSRQGLLADPRRLDPAGRRSPGHAEKIERVRLWPRLTDDAFVHERLPRRLARPAGAGAGHRRWGGRLDPARPRRQSPSRSEDATTGREDRVAGACAARLARTGGDPPGHRFRRLPRPGGGSHPGHPAGEPDRPARTPRPRFPSVPPAQPEALSARRYLREGKPTLPTLGAASDVRTDLPAYDVHRHGRLEACVPDIRDLWAPDMVAFAPGCSFTFEHTPYAKGSGSGTSITKGRCRCSAPASKPSPPAPSAAPCWSACAPSTPTGRDRHRRRAPPSARAAGNCVVQGARRSGRMSEVMVGTIPYLFVMLAMVGLLIAFPQICLFLPEVLR